MSFRYSLLATLTCMLMVGISVGPDRVLAKATPWNYGYKSAARLHVANIDGELFGGLEIRLDPGWKTYWRSTGSLGFPPVIDISQSENVKAAELLYPAPKRFVAFDLEQIGYFDNVLFPIRLTQISPDRPIKLRFKIEALVCGQVCVPASYSLAYDLPSGASVWNQAEGRHIAHALARVPVPALDYDIAVSGIIVSEKKLSLELKALTHNAAAFHNALAIGELEGSDPLIGKLTLRADNTLTSEFFPEQPIDPGTPVRFTFVGEKVAIDLIADTIAAPAIDGKSLAASVLPSLWMILGLAFAGGLILNVMPCVFPVLSLKIARLAKAGAQDRRTVRLGFLANAAGILTFLLLLAGLLGGLKLSGIDIFWGMQFQQPVFVASLILILVMFTLNLSGLLRFDLPARFGQLLGRYQRSHDFLDGFVVALVATPCTAPFLGTAISFAFAGSISQLFVIFVAMGLGFAFPFLLIAAFPIAVSILPAPGRWMIIVQRLLVIPMLAVLIWLGFILIHQIETSSFTVFLLLLLIFAAAFQLPRFRLGAAVGLAAAAIAVVAIAGAIQTNSIPSAQTALVEPGIWSEFQPAMIERHVANGHVVVVDVTADWCVTCVYNKTVALDRPEVTRLLEVPSVIAMQADWTRPDPLITAFLKKHDRYGIPLNVVYGPRAPDGLVLPEILSPSAVIAAIGKAGAAPLALRSQDNLEPSIKNRSTQ